METNLSQERLETLLALAVAFSEKGASDASAPEKSRVAESAKRMLSALPEEDLEKISNKLSYYLNLPDQEKKSWKARVLGRIKGSTWLDRNIHHSHICEVLREEPLHLQCFILSNLPANIADPIAIALGIFQPFRNFIESAKKQRRAGKPEPTEIAPGKNPLKNDPTHLVRQTFLANFVSLEDIYSPKPIDYLSDEDIIQSLYLLGVGEIALACCGIKEIENLASFLRQFSAYTSQLIVDKLAGLKDVDPARVALAEKAIQSWWEKADKNPSALVGIIGGKKFAMALTKLETIQYEYIMLKLPLALSKRIEMLYLETKEKIAENDSEEIELAEIAYGEMEALASQFLMDKLNEKKKIDPGFEAPEFNENNNQAGSQ